MRRAKTRWPLELEAGLQQAVEQALGAQKKDEPRLKRNEFLSRLLRRGMSAEAKSPVVRLRCADNLEMAKFRGDIAKLEQLFVRVRQAIMHRNRPVDRDDPESVKRFIADDIQTKKFLTACEELLKVARERAWDLRGFRAEDLFILRKGYLDTWKAQVEKHRTNIERLEIEDRKSPLQKEIREQLHKERGNVTGLSLLIDLLEFAIPEEQHGR